MTLNSSPSYSPTVEDAMRKVYRSLNEKDRRRYVAVEALKFGWGGQTYIASVVGCSRPTIGKGISELQSPDFEEQNIVGVRRPGGGRKNATEAHPELIKNFS